MKTTLFLILCSASVLVSGCTSSHRSSAASSVSRTSYDPAKDVTTIEKDGYTWQLKGPVTNAVLTPKATP